MAEQIRLYGPGIGNASIARVTAGMKSALAHLGQLAGFVPCDMYDEEEWYGGPDAPIAVCASGASLGFARTNGWHKSLYVLVPPNSTWVPEDPLRNMAKMGVCLLSPSSWGKQMLDDACKRAGANLRVSVWKHGVSDEFKPNAEALRAMLAAYEQGHFSAVHFASEATQRKGTLKLLEAWCLCVDAGSLGQKPTLRLVVDAPWGTFDKFLRDIRASEKARKSIVWTDVRPDLTPAGARAYYQARHLVVQPSRGEGFGLVPLEARASGVPVMMTGCTGHSEYVGCEGFAGTVVVPTTSEYMPMDDGPDGKAPTFLVTDLVDALSRAYECWPTLAQEAVEAAPRVGAQWSWTKVTREWLAQEGIE